MVRHLDTNEEIRTRGHWLSDPRKLARDFDILDRAHLEGNTLFGWFRSMIFPRSGD